MSWTSCAYDVIGCLEDQERRPIRMETFKEDEDGRISA